ncbi:inositol monophosphatase family protein [Agromyces allii]|uniref:Inositol monophosphatase family protein n=1 Tax=Agromyces allii TaxID=393607 RepID=A0ABN2QJT3_9MICO|nr:inositol monophosphatase family protein [Agromyces allii]
MFSDAEVAVHAAQAGAAVARARFGTESHRIRDTGVDFTTDADVEAERAIRAVLAKHRPDDGVLGEEFGGSNDRPRRWLVDPICGTLNHAAGVPLYAVNVSLEIDGVTSAAAIADPAAGQTFWTDGIEARRRDGPSRGQESDVDVPIAPAPTSRIVTVNLESHYPGSIADRLLFDATFREQFSPRCLSTTLALSWVATGQHAGYITGGDLRSSVHWSAGIALCRAAGARVTNLTGGDLHTGAHGLIAAADAETHARMLAVLNTMR